MILLRLSTLPIDKDNADRAIGPLLDLTDIHVQSLRWRIGQQRFIQSTIMNPPGEGYAISYIKLKQWSILLEMPVYYIDSNPALQAFDQKRHANAHVKTISSRALYSSPFIPVIIWRRAAFPPLPRSTPLFVPVSSRRPRS